jgi:A/G-specific adenine glycosylase
MLMPLLTNRDGAILLYRRPPSGLWGGLWSLPELHSSAELSSLALQHGLSLGQQQPMAALKHTFSHFQLTIEPQLIRVEHSLSAVAEGDWLWYNLATPPRLGLAAPVKKLLKRAADHLTAGDLL